MNIHKKLIVEKKKIETINAINISFSRLKKFIILRKK